jgi:hypothetical protein
LTAFGFSRRGDFSLSEFAWHPSGFQEAPFDVVCRFKSEAAIVLGSGVFHPGQTVEDMPDGSLIVRFCAGGALEMSWPLYTWDNPEASRTFGKCVTLKPGGESAD